jgi:hypothetical protein
MSTKIPPDWYDEPSADPKIQKDYEAALGAFLVIFNSIENVVSDLICLTLKKFDRENLLKSLEGDLFHRKLITLDLLSIAYPRVASNLLIEELRCLGAKRNNLAHGHFDQNPFDGSYQIVTSRKAIPMPIAQILALTVRAEKAWNELRNSQVFFEVNDLFTQ